MARKRGDAANERSGHDEALINSVAEIFASFTEFLLHFQVFQAFSR